MGFLSRLLSLRASATLTIAATRGRTRGVGYPPPIRFQLLLPLLLAAGVSAQAAAPYLTNLGYTNTWTVGPNPFHNLFGEVIGSAAQTNSYAAAYTHGSGAYLRTKTEEHTTWTDPPYDWRFSKIQSTHTWGWIAGGLDAGQTTELQICESSIPGESSASGTNYSPAAVQFPLPTAGVYGSLTVGNTESGQNTDQGSSTMQFNTGGPEGSTTNRLWRLKLNLWLSNPDFPWGVQIPLFQMGVSVTRSTA
ncbi:MAG: hypothetical protein ABMA26_25145 [Limisphaerales bacterium]